MSSPTEPRAVAPSERADAKRLTDYLQRLERGRLRPAAVHLQIRERFHSLREDALIRLALRPLRDLARERGAPIFVLSPREWVVICENVDPVQAIAAGRVPAADPLLPMTAMQPMVRRYDLAETDDRLALFALARAHASGAASALESAAVEPGTRPLDTRTLASIDAQLKTVRVAELIRQQTAFTVTSDGRFEPLFAELFVSIAELQRRFAPQTDMSARPALFRYLTERLDDHVLTAVAEGRLSSEHPMSLNLGVRSIGSPAFQAMLSARDRTRPLYIEVQMSDLLAFPAGFQEASKIAREGRCHFGIDGITPLMLSFLELGTLTTDFVKIAWESHEAASGPPQRREEFVARLARIGIDRIVFTRIETVEALESAIGFGVKRLQGSLVDRLVLAAAPQSGT